MRPSLRRSRRWASHPDCQVCSAASIPIDVNMTARSRTNSATSSGVARRATNCMDEILAAQPFASSGERGLCSPLLSYWAEIVRRRASRKVRRSCPPRGVAYRRPWVRPSGASGLGGASSSASQGPSEELQPSDRPGRAVASREQSDQRREGLRRSGGHFPAPRKVHRQRDRDKRGRSPA